MQNFVWGVVTMLTCATGYLRAWKEYKRGRHSASLILIIICGFFLRVYVGSDLYLHDWDERYHALVAKNLTRHWLTPTLYDAPILPYDFRAWTANHIWLHKQPVCLWLIAISIKLFGTSPFAVRIPAILLTTLAIGLVYDIARNWYDRQVAIITAFLFSIHGLIIELAAGREGTDHVDAIFLFFIVLSVWVANKAIERKSLWLQAVLGASIGLGVLTKWLPALISIPVWAILTYVPYHGKRLKMLVAFLCIILAAVAVALPWQLYILHTFPREAAWEFAYNNQHLYSALEAHQEGIWYYFDQLRMKYGELIYLPVLWFTWYSFRNKNATNYAVLVWFWGVYLFFTLVRTKMVAYTLIAAPPVFIMTACAFSSLSTLIRDSNGAARLLMSAIRIGLIILPIRYSVERVKPFEFLDRNTDWNETITMLGRASSIDSKTVLSNCPHPIETMFAIDCVAYPHQLDSSEKNLVISQGYRIVEFH